MRARNPMKRVNTAGWCAVKPLTSRLICVTPRVLPYPGGPKLSGELVFSPSTNNCKWFFCNFIAGHPSRYLAFSMGQMLAKVIQLDPLRLLHRAHIVLAYFQALWLILSADFLAFVSSSGPLTVTHLFRCWAVRLWGMEAEGQGRHQIQIMM